MSKPGRKEKPAQSDEEQEVGLEDLPTLPSASPSSESEVEIPASNSSTTVVLRTTGAVDGRGSGPEFVFAASDDYEESDDEYIAPVEFNIQA